ncbi:TetR/AcrR family transcriptional regulator [Loigolactobacillus bifermentans]|jgi:AcrR family transcriptional regulator|uniref:HTH tetR-type domain-containing protein n=1 Tax=Loigolactobacillus bifermentans DSM 20003 TaxID=1423726 RepID=A0A0R1GPZ8_9LACO|nr:TetR/AcrR family transcriptional regulator [Loigolactobacillus bifermentans]KRK34515.1 hypothetical protein FC07_GL000526 [Loigolactobacillus bifermentans DSM 20003]QGG61290.1 TetR family transcriptional regulator [Loigolactobacillus bifermentans]
MKFEEQGSLTRNGQRVWRDFSAALQQLLTEQAFEKITVQTLCQRANYPRATFYNYFYDKYDLLDGCWAQLMTYCGFDQVRENVTQATLVACFDQLYQLLAAQQPYLQQVLRHNSSALLPAQLQTYMVRTNQVLFKGTRLDTGQVPLPLAIAHCYASIFLVLKWIFLENHPTTLAQAHQYLAVLDAQYWQPSH